MSAGQTPTAATIEAAVASVTRLNNPPRFVLGSKSASRRAILEAAVGSAPFDVVVPDIDEKAIGDRLRDAPVDLVSQIALAKADALADALKESHPNVVLLTGDQVVTYEGVVREKPVSKDEARSFIESYGRAPCSTVGAVCLHDLASGRRVLGVDVAQISYEPMPAAVVEELVGTEEVMWCAGGLMVEHPASAPYLRAIEGGVDSVMGLSSRLLASLLTELRATEAAGGGGGSAVLRQRSWAVVGDVLNPAKPASRIVQRLKDEGRAVALCNPRDQSGQCFTSLADAARATEGGEAGRVEAVNLVIAPSLGVGVVEDMWRLGIRYLFVQPGADSTEVLQRARGLGLVVEQGCVLVQPLPPVPVKL